MKKVVVGVIVLVAIVGMFKFNVLSGLDGYDIDGNKITNEELEGWVIETEVEGPEDCTSLEEYDAEISVCYIECDTSEQCDEMEKKLDKALEELEDNYTEFAKNLKLFKGNVEDLEESAEVVYGVQKGEKFVVISGAENSNHKKIVKWLSVISPDDFSDKYIARIILYTKIGADTTAYVAPNSDNPTKWDMYVNMDTMADGEKEMVFTLIHEYAHILTLNSSQMTNAGAEQEIVGEKDGVYCRNYMVLEGCLKENSYLNIFYQNFWEEKFDAQAEDPLDNYDKNPQAFTSEYGATNPGEDIAETFSSFVIKKKPLGTTIAEQKILFFYNYPNLLEIRNSVRVVLKGLARKSVGW